MKFKKFKTICINVFARRTSIIIKRRYLKKILTFKDGKKRGVYICGFVYRNKSYAIEYNYCDLGPNKWQLINPDSWFPKEFYCTLDDLLDTLFEEERR